jgi:hypothetical protein
MPESHPTAQPIIASSTSGFRNSEDYALFGLLVLHGLCQPDDLAPLAAAQRADDGGRPLLEILAEINELDPKKQKDIRELLGLLATPRLRDSLPHALPAMATIRQSFSIAATAVTPEDPSLARTVPVGGITARASATAVSTPTAGPTLVSGSVTRLTKDEVERMDRSRAKGKLIGRELSGHVVIDRIGSGGQGDVYLAKQLSLNRYVALKSLEVPPGADLQRFMQMFRSEAETLARINHARIVKIFEIFESEGGAWFTMEHINGKTIRDLVKESGFIPVDVVANIACQVCSALQRTSEDGLIHRDIKPNNIMLDENGEVKIVDFGLAGLTAQFTGGTGQFSGTPQYAAPEQASGLPLTPKVDQYCLGLTLYYALTGKNPIDGRTLQEVLFKQVNEMPAPPSEIVDSIPREADRTIMRMIDKDPEKRFRSFSECYTAWEKVLQTSAHGQVTTGRALLGETLLRMSREDRSSAWRNAVTLGIGGVVVVAGAMALEGPLRAAEAHDILDLAGDIGTAMLAFSLACIGYVALVRRKLIPAVLPVRQVLWTHIATAVPSVALLLLHSGNFLSGTFWGEGPAKNVMSVIVGLALIATALSGAAGLAIFRVLQRRQRLEQMELRGAAPANDTESFLSAVSAKALSGWRLVHYPLAVLLVFLSLLHILASLHFRG